MSKYTENFPNLSTYDFDTIMCQLKQVCGADPSGLINAQFLSRPTTAKDIALLLHITYKLFQSQIELQKQFVELYTFVKDFFENLDLQEEVNNWLEKNLTTEAITELIQKWIEPLDYITPEMYGCIGDGITDDTENLQKAIDAAISKKKKLTSSKSRKYLISKTINIKGDYCYIDFAGATILTNADLTDMIDISVYNTDHILSYISGITIIGSTCENCINMHNFREIVLNNINIDEFKNAGVFLSGSSYELILKNSSINGNKSNSSYGVYLSATSTDNVFDNIMITNCNYGVYNLSAGNMFFKIHGWIEPTAIVSYSDSEFVYSNGVNNHFVGCTSDTFKKGFHLLPNVPINISNCSCYVVSNYQEYSVGKPCFLYIDPKDNYPQHFKNAVIINCYVNLNDYGDFINEKQNNFYLKNAINNIFNNSPYYFYYDISAILSDNITIDYGELLIINGKAYLKCGLKSSKSFSNTFSHLINIPPALKPTKTFETIVGISTSRYSFTAYGCLSVSSSSINVNTQTTGNYVTIDINWEIAQS